MNIKSLIKRTPFYSYMYLPYSQKKRNKIKGIRHELFVKEGLNALRLFSESMNEAGIKYWMEFGTLLGAYRDNDFVPNELDLDMGVFLEDADKTYQVLVKAGFRLVREFHVVGECGLEQTYEYRGTTLDVMYFFKKNNQFYCTGAAFDLRDINGKPFFAQTTSHVFKPFDVSDFTFKEIECKVPANIEEHLIEIFGEGFRVYDPNFRGDLNKTYYSFEEKKSIGFVIY